MQTTTNAQLRPLDSLTPLAPAKDFLQTLETALGWQSIKQTLLTRIRQPPDARHVHRFGRQDEPAGALL